MIRNMLVIVVSIAVPVLLAFQPIFPLIEELREYSQEGESFIQVWRFVTLPDFYNAAQYARDGWLETTWRNYLILAGVNYGGLLGVFFVVRNVLSRAIYKHR